MTTPNTGLVELPQSAFPEAAEANETFRRLDVLVQCRVRSEAIAAPPGDAVQGDAFIVPAPATGMWEPHQRQIAYLTQLGWRYILPRRGFRAKVLDTGRLREYTGSAWGPALNGSGDTASLPDAVGGIGASLSYEVDVTAAGLQEIVLLDDVLVVLTGAVEGKVCTARLIVRQDDAGGHLLSWPSNTFWPGGSPPEVSTEPRIVNVFEIESHDGGAGYWCRLIAKSVYSGSDLPPTYPTSDDPLAASTPHVLHFDGTDGSITFTDEKGPIWTAYVDTHAGGICEIDTAASKFGSAAGHFIGGDGAGGAGHPRGGNFICTPGVVGNDMTVSDFTIEGWIKLDIDPLTASPGGGLILARGLNSSGAGFVIGTGSSFSMRAVITPDQTVHPGVVLVIDGEGMTDGMGTYAFDTTQFKHFHFGRRGNKFYYGVNGRTRNSDLSPLGLASWFSTHTFGAIPGAGETLNVGGVPIDNALSDQCMTAWLDELRITVGACRYVEDYTPPVLPFAVPTPYTAPDGENADGWPVFLTEGVVNENQRRLELLEGDGITLAEDDGGVQIQADAGAAGGGSGVDAPPSSPEPADDEFSTGTGLDTTGARRSGATPWTKTAYVGGTTEEVVQGSLAMIASGTSGPVVVRQPIAGPAAVWQYTAKLALFNEAFGNFNHFGLHAYHAATTKWQTIHLLYSSAANIEVAKWTGGTFNVATTQGDVFSSEMFFRDWVYLQIEFDLTNLLFRWSPTGRKRSFKTFVSEAYTSHFGSGNRPDQIGLHIHPSGVAGLIGFCDWFRRTG